MGMCLVASLWQRLSASGRLVIRTNPESVLAPVPSRQELSGFWVILLFSCSHLPPKQGQAIILAHESLNEFW